jgi:uncharacterized protein GlcG (DUF336 family)
MKLKRACAGILSAAVLVSFPLAAHAQPLPNKPVKVIIGLLVGGEGLRFLAVPGVTPLEGGYPIVVGNKVVGGIGVSGVLSHQDAQVAQAGPDAL